MKKRISVYSLIIMVCLLFTCCVDPSGPDPLPPGVSNAPALLPTASPANTPGNRNHENNGYIHLNEIMDLYHAGFDIYSDQDAGGNHGSPSGWMGDITGLTMDTADSNACSGTTCVKLSWTKPVSEPWIGTIWLSADNNWGVFPDCGYDLGGATGISLMARGEYGGEPIFFLFGGVQGAYPDSVQPQLKTQRINLTKEWKKYTIDISGCRLNSVIGLFGWMTSIDPVFYFDDIRINRPRLDEPRFLTSFVTLSLDSPDKYLTNAAYSYDNAVALLAYLARSSEDDMRLAKLIGDAFVTVQENDRTYSDGRIRNGYMSGDLLDIRTGKARIPGWWEPDEKKFYEDYFCTSLHSGNIAWPAIALTEYNNA